MGRGPGFDPELFDLRAVNAALMRLATNRWGNRNSITAMQVTRLRLFDKLKISSW